jgi:hypothetical protein
MALKKITREEKAQMHLIPSASRGRQHLVRMMLQTMKVGEMFSVGTEDFKWKNRTPRYFITKISKKGKKKFELFTNLDGSGWVVERKA